MTNEEAETLVARYWDNRPARGEENGRARRTLTQTALILATISRFVATKARQESIAEFQFALDPRHNAKTPAGMARKPGEPVYGARISLAFIERLHDRVATVKALRSRSFDPAAFATIAAVAAIGHEFAHGLYGHAEDAETTIPRSRYLEELDADRRGGAGSLSLYIDRDLRQIMQDRFQIGGSIDFMEAAFLGHSLLAWTLEGGDADLYAPPGLRSFLYFDGLRSVALQTGFADESQITFARNNADRIAREIAPQLDNGDRLLEIRDDHASSEMLMSGSLRLDLYRRADETVVVSPFWP